MAVLAGNSAGVSVAAVCPVAASGTEVVGSVDSVGSADGAQLVRFWGGWYRGLGGFAFHLGIEDLDRPRGQRISPPSNLLAVIPLDLHAHPVGPDDPPGDTVVGAAHPAANPQCLPVRRRFLLACHRCNSPSSSFLLCGTAPQRQDSYLAGGET